MAFDPNLPANNALITAAELRDQLNALKALIDQRPTTAQVETMIKSLAAANVNTVGSAGPDPGDPVSQNDVQAVVDKLNTLIEALWQQ